MGVSAVSGNGAGPAGVRTCDVLVVGGGPAGIAAATRAAEAGARVVVADLGLRPGGQVWRHTDRSHLPRLARRWLARCERSGAEWLAAATVTHGTVERGFVVVREGHAMVVRPRAVVIATGARERFLPYPGWTLPNTMGVGGAQALLKGGADVRGLRAVVAGSGPLLLPVAAALARAGAVLVAVAEQAPWHRVAAFATRLGRHPFKLLQAAAYRAAFLGAGYRTGTWVASAAGNRRVERVSLTDGHRRWVEACDLLCCSYGLVPSTELARLLGCAVEDGRVVVDHLQRTSVPHVYCAGEPTGIAGELAALVQGEIAGLAAAGAEAMALSRRLQRARSAWLRFGARLDRAFAPREELRALPSPETIVCRCEDVRFGQLEPSWTGRQAKLYTRIGMGPCQGAVCGPACQFLLGWPPGTVRPPLGAPPVGAWIDVAAPAAAE
jgi:NADPH-dependent 2,4-dienoyl-CoA reductase/sulfur reductase-like enzyme